MTISKRAILSLSLILATLAPNSEADTTKPAQRVIALAPHITELLFSIDAGAQIVGVSAFSNYPEQAKTLPDVANFQHINIEQVIALKPDLIIAWRGGNPDKELAKLRQLGFRVVESSPNTFDDIAHELLLFGELTGHQQKAAQVAELLRLRLASIKQQYANKTAIHLFYQLWHKPLQTIANNSWPQQFFTYCGAVNPFANAQSPYPQVSIEQVLTKPIDAIVMPAKQDEIKPEFISYWQQWPMVNAVKHQQFIPINADKAHRMTLRSADELELFCQRVDNVRAYYQAH